VGNRRAGKEKKNRKRRGKKKAKIIGKEKKEREEKGKRGYKSAEKREETHKKKRHSESGKRES